MSRNTQHNLLPHLRGFYLLLEYECPSWTTECEKETCFTTVLCGTRFGAFGACSAQQPNLQHDFHIYEIPRLENRQMPRGTVAFFHGEK